MLKETNEPFNISSLHTITHTNGIHTLVTYFNPSYRLFVYSLIFFLSSYVY